MKKIVLELPDDDYDAVRDAYAAVGAPVLFRAFAAALLNLAAGWASSGEISKKEIMEEAGK